MYVSPDRCNPPLANNGAHQSRWWLMALQVIASLLFSVPPLSAQNEILVSGVVIDKKSTPVADVSVQYVCYGDAPLVSAVTDTNGQFEFTIPEATVIEGAELPSSFHLGQNYPNPFNPTTLINVALAEGGRFTIHDLTGRLINDIRIPAGGTYLIEWGGRNGHGHPCSAGIYIYSLESANSKQARKMVLLDGGRASGLAIYGQAGTKAWFQGLWSQDKVYGCQEYLLRLSSKYITDTDIPFGEQGITRDTTIIQKVNRGPYWTSTLPDTAITLGDTLMLNLNSYVYDDGESSYELSDDEYFKVVEDSLLVYITQPETVTVQITALDDANDPELKAVDALTVSPKAQPTWAFLGFDGKLPARLRIFHSQLYACAGSDGLWRTDTRTQDIVWEYLGMADTSLGHHRNRGVTDVLINKDSPQTMLVAFQPEKAADHGVFRSDDGGATWFPSDSGLKSEIPPPFAQTVYEHPNVFLDTEYDLFGARTNIVHTENFGELWRVITPIHGTATWAYALRNHDKEPQIMWLGGVSAVFSPILVLSVDGGETWDYIDLEKIVPIDNSVLSIAFDAENSNILYVGMLQEMLKTVDRGSTWTILPISDQGVGSFLCLVEDRRRPGHLFASRGPVIWETENGGVDWDILASPNQSDVFSMLYDSDEEALYIGTDLAGSNSGVFVYK